MTIDTIRADLIRQMPPRQSFSDSTDGASSDLKRLSDFGVGLSLRRSRSDRSDDLRRESLSAAILQGSVLHVQTVIADKQVVGSNARRVVAPVKNEGIVWDRTIGDLPRDTMRRFWTLWSMAHGRHLSVTMGVERTSPKPTIARLIDLLPEAISDGAMFPRSQVRAAHIHDCSRVVA